MELVVEIMEVKTSNSSSNNNNNKDLDHLQVSPPRSMEPLSPPYQRVEVGGSRFLEY
jgi:hypothetical protein